MQGLATHVRLPTRHSFQGSFAKPEVGFAFEATTAALLRVCVAELEVAGFPHPDACPAVLTRPDSTGGTCCARASNP